MILDLSLEEIQQLPLDPDESRECLVQPGGGHRLRIVTAPRQVAAAGHLLGSGASRRRPGVILATLSYASRRWT